MCISGEYEREFVKRDFNVKEESIIVTGLPRNDRLYHTTQEELEFLRRKFAIPEGKKIILYAPTWRDSNDGGRNYSLLPPVDWQKWEQKLRGSYVLFLRTHPNTTSEMKVTFNDFLRDYTSYPDINDLLLVSDILISDYSSTILDYCILDRPVVCFGYDFQEYSRMRGFYFDLRTTLPSGVMENEDDVLDYILSSDYAQECEKTKCFHRAHIEVGGDATKICVEKLLGLSMDF
jgi:CDP-glycerol glycerophosphotransferase